MATRRRWALVLSTAVAWGAVLPSGVAVARPLVCPAPKPLTASLQRPPAGASATQLANFLLALPQRKPCEVGRFSSKWFNGQLGLYPEGAQLEPAAVAIPGVALAEAKVRGDLVRFLRVHFAGNQVEVAKTLAVFDRADVKKKVPDPTLRAALVSLRGTVAEVLVEWFVRSTPSVTTVRFGGAPLGTIATVSGYGTLTMLFARRYAGEHFALLSPVFAHEILHHDARVTPTEEVLLHAINAAVYMQLLNRHPELGAGGTELSRLMNDEVLMFVNSRAPGASRSVIIAPTGKGTAPGSAKSRRDLYGHGADFSIFRNQAPAATDTSPAPSVYPTVLSKLLLPGVALPKPPTYNKKTAELMARSNDTWLSPVDRLRVSVLLGLVSMEEIVRYTGLTRARAISTFRLAPILPV